MRWLHLERSADMVLGIVTVDIKWSGQGSVREILSSRLEMLWCLKCGMNTSGGIHHGWHCIR